MLIETSVTVEKALIADPADAKNKAVAAAIEEKLQKQGLGKDLS